MAAPVRRRRRARWLALLLPACAALLAVACIPREQADVPLATLPVDQPVLKEIRGAQVYLLRRPDGAVIALWGISPLPPPAGQSVRCFIQDRTDHPFRGEARPFLDPCRGAWWTRDGIFLGFNTDPEGMPSDGPSLIHIPVEVRNDRVIVDQARLDCLQNRTC
jgi:hypothetical protein